jgi:two-component system, response regulator YesN
MGKGCHVLIVDDEVHAVRGIQAGVDWDKLGITKIHSANNLRQAQEVFRNQQVDLLLTDIDMPRGSGIDLLTWVREEYPATEAIFLTCHSEFEYAKKAIKLKSLNYLLKPVDYKELEDAMQSALHKIQSDRQQNIVEESYQQLQQVHDSILKERFWLDLINQVVPSTPEKIKEHMKFHHVSFSDSTTFLPVLIHVQSWKPGLSTQEERTMEIAFKNAVQEEIAKNDVNAPVLSIAEDYLLVIFPSESSIDRKEFMKDSESFITDFTHYFSCQLCCYVGKQVRIHEVEKVVKMLQELDCDNVTSVNKTLLLMNTNKERQTCSSVPRLSMDRWTNLLKAGLKEKLFEEINQYFADWQKIDGEITARSLYLFYQDFLQLLFYVIQVKGIQANQVFSQNLLTGETKRVFKSLQSLNEWVLYITEIAMNQLHSANENDSVIDKVKQFIKENISSNKLSREDIANHVYLNPDYLTRLFKKQTGSSISEYLQYERIEYAKKLLMETNQSVSDIAIESGYANFSYFSTIFKKATKLNPMEFRKIHSII